MRFLLLSNLCWELNCGGCKLVALRLDPEYYSTCDISQGIIR